MTDQEYTAMDGPCPEGACEVCKGQRAVFVELPPSPMPDGEGGFKEVPTLTAVGCPACVTVESE